jgi:hypothetical protein
VPGARGISGRDYNPKKPSSGASRHPYATIVGFTGNSLKFFGNTTNFLAPAADSFLHSEHTL